MGELWWADPDPWAWSPDEQAALDEKRRKREEADATRPDEPPF